MNSYAIINIYQFNTKQSNIAIASIISRLVVPGSELRSHNYLTEKSALDELLDTDFSNLPLQQLYLASDRLLTQKDFIDYLKTNGYTYIVVRRDAKLIILKKSKVKSLPIR